MESIYEHKESAVTETPVFLFECALPDQTVERWSTHRLLVNGQVYEPRVVRHNTFEVSTASDQGVDVIPRVSLVLANADGHFSQVERSVGWKGRDLTVALLFVDLTTSQAATDTVVLFRGLLNPPDQITEKEFRLSAVNRMNLQRVLLPSVRIQKRCPWEFPRSSEERTQGGAGGPEGQYSPFFKCGYSPEVEGGAGNMNGTAPFASCNYTRQDCQQRGMFSEDSSLRPTKRFGGIEFVPASILVRTSGDRAWHQSPVVDNEARFNDFVPMVYGMAWCTPPVVFSRNDGNLTYFEVLLGLGEIEEVQKVVVNNIEIPLGVSGRSMTGTGWFNVASTGNRTGGFNLNFKDGAGIPQGDPYGSMAYLSVAVPNRIDDGKSLPRVNVLMKGLRLPHYTESGEYAGTWYSNNPAWILLDVLRRTGWMTSEVDLGSFARAAAYCQETINAEDLHGNTVHIPRFQCNIALRKRRTAAEVVRSVRNSARLFLTYSMAGLLEVRVENALAVQQPTKPPGSNANGPLNGGWPSYEFGDGTTGFGGILRREGGESSLRVFSRSTSDTPNRFAVEFQDEFNEYQQDSLSLVDVDDVRRIGQEIGGPVYATGIANFNQAARVLKLCLDRSVSGNTYVEFETSVRAIGLQPGDPITLTYLREGFLRQLFRVIRIEPSSGFRTAKITGQIHRDEWFGDENMGDVGGRGSHRQPKLGSGVPKPLIGAVLDSQGNIGFDLSERVSGESDGGSAVEILVGFTAPPEGTGFETGVPMLSLAPVIGSGGGIEADQVLYYAVSAVGSGGEESELSFVVRASIPPGASDRTVTLERLSFPSNTSTFRVYRGISPSQLYLLAQDLSVAAQYTDTGATYQLASPRDPDFHHANFYWRFEVQPEVSATIHSDQTIGNGALLMQTNQHRGRIVRITRGTGRGQERGILSNSETAMILSRPWAEQPDASSFFVIVESGWRFGGTASSSPGAVQVPNRSGATIHISGRSANASDVESPEELATVSRWTIGGGGALGYDLGPPPAPEFSLALPANGKGFVELSGISFADLSNTRGVTSATLRLFFWNELQGVSGVNLATALSSNEDLIGVTIPHSISTGSLIQVDNEILRVMEVLSSGEALRVIRGTLGSLPTAHNDGSAVFQLSEQTSTIAFPRDFFGSPASGSWKYPVFLPNARIAGAEVQVSNGLGGSPVSSACVTQTIDGGLRTLSGGQISFTIGGFLAIQDGAVPDFVTERDRSIGSVHAIVQQAPSGTSSSGILLRLRQGTAPLCTLTIPNGSTTSNTVNGFGLPVLQEGSKLSLDVLSVGATTPGSDLTVTIQL